MAARSLPRRFRATRQSLGSLITQHLGEFDRTVKVYGGELVERLSQRTDEVTDAMRTHVDSFDSRVSARTSEAATVMDERITRLGEALDGRIHSLNEALGARVMEIAKSLADGGKEVVGALEKRIDEASGTINSRGTALADTLHEKADEIDKTLGRPPLEIAEHARCAHYALPGIAGRARRDCRLADRGARPVGRQCHRLAHGAAQPGDPQQCGRSRALAGATRRHDRRSDPQQRA